MELLLFGALNGTTADSLDNIGYIAPVLHPEYCSGKNVRGYCAGAQPFMLEAMKHKTGKVVAPDYKGDQALVAYSYIHVSKDLPPDAQYTQKVSACPYQGPRHRSGGAQVEIPTEGDATRPSQFHLCSQHGGGGRGSCSP